MYIKNNLIKGFLIDIDGVILASNKLISGSLKFIKNLNNKKIPYRFLTNNTTKNKKQLMLKLKKAGLTVNENKIISAGLAGISYLKKIGSPSCHLYLNESLLKEYSVFNSNKKNKKYVLIGDRGNSWNYTDLNEIFNLLMSGCELISLHKGKYFEKKRNLQIDIGSIVSALEYCSGKKSVVIGKPSKEFFSIAINSLNLNPINIAMIGDDLFADIEGAKLQNINTILVKTGKFRDQIVKNSLIKPDLIIKSIDKMNTLI